MTEPNEPQRRRRRPRLTDDQVKVLPKQPKGSKQIKRYHHTDPEMAGHVIRVMPFGANRFYAVERNPLTGKQVWHKIGSADQMSIADAREAARLAIARIKKGLAPVEALPTAPDSVEAVCEAWLKRYVAPRKLRTEANIRRNIAKHILPAIGSRPFTSLRRSDIAILADRIEDSSGARMADVVVSILKSISAWVASRDDAFTPVFIGKAMKRDTAGARSRTLDDDEIRRLWAAAQTEGAFGALCMLLLLLGQRKSIVVNMRHADIERDVWSIRQEKRAKGNVQKVRLPPMVLDAIAKQPRFAGNDFVLAGRGADGAGPLANFSRAKKRIDRKSGVGGWRVHDLRRTHRSLASRASVPRDHAERVMGHRPPGVESVYDHHDYTEEKSMALRKVAALVEQIVHGEPGGNIVRMPSAPSQ